MAGSASVSLFQTGTAAPAPTGRAIDWLPVANVISRPACAADDLQLVTTRAGFDALEADWISLFERAGRGEQMFQTFNWLWHWTNHFCLEDCTTLAIVTVRREGRLIAVLPLALERVVGLKQLVFMGAPVSQYGDAVAEQVPDQAAVVEQALRFGITRTRADVVRLAKVRDDAIIAPVLTRMQAEMTGAEAAPYADLAAAGGQEAFDRRFSTKVKKNRRRQERRLAEHGAIGLDWKLSQRAAADAAATTMVLKRAWLKTRGQLSRTFADPRSERFFADVCAGAQRPTGAQVSLLTTGGEIANAAITVTIKGRQALHILAYGLKFERCAPGAFHMERLVEQAFATGVTMLDFLAPRHEYKLEWADGALRVADYALPISLAGKAYTSVYLCYVREGVKAVLKSLPNMRGSAWAWVKATVQKVRG